MSRCIMYKDIADCDKAPCGKHCKVYLAMQETDEDEDVCVKCERDQGPCGLGVRVCTMEGECPYHVPVASIGTAFDCYTCTNGVLYNCYAGRA